MYEKKGATRIVKRKELEKIVLICIPMYGLFKDDFSISDYIAWSDGMRSD
jgi:hypothetical protein